MPCPFRTLSLSKISSTLNQSMLVRFRWKALIAMFSLLDSAFTTLGSSFRARASLQLEILALRHQINVPRKSQQGRVHLKTADRLFRKWLMHLWSGWRSALAIVKPKTVISREGTIIESQSTVWQDLAVSRSQGPSNLNVGQFAVDPVSKRLHIANGKCSIHCGISPSGNMIGNDDALKLHFS